MFKAYWKNIKTFLFFLTNKPYRKNKDANHQPSQFEKKESDFFKLGMGRSTLSTAFCSLLLRSTSFHEVSLSSFITLLCFKVEFFFLTFLMLHPQKGYTMKYGTIPQTSKLFTPLCFLLNSMLSRIIHCLVHSHRFVNVMPYTYGRNFDNKCSM